MGSSRPGALRRLTERLTSSSDELHSGDLKREPHDPGVVPIGDLEPRALVTVCGEVRSITLRPRDDVPALEVELYDGTDSLHLVWLGRRRIAGISPGITVQATGRVTRQRDVTTIFNPSYEIIGRHGAGHG